ncbi:hypothetical protein [Pseudoalteromonas luteoviolacea]|uniref:Uncharacterized protein n=1 Tax=Pseudoalteromonas luteoviolacea H33 TaxID=1365251 RepID=A0A167FBC3_9GAMM|nr:hypothetical protein [Pseudoalteromonas luteoviolacea]KZN52015.1 hypothetical protein N476_01415 [Pseudoalteromonas luteoviolacea H33]KZN78731.1 hypothetical protein N477_07890 [Pseudoalteromonas luteoviolacea H33-S]MBQ4876094.1 hypothetical protein [Pseudoalteromonas luteoviolacea]MBQ4905729.1 hypothetical protein [Pseudoalteromonas luteoviolacea]
MKLKINKKNVKSLSPNTKRIAFEQTAHVAGGTVDYTGGIHCQNLSAGPNLCGDLPPYTGRH